MVYGWSWCFALAVLAQQCTLDSGDCTAEPMAGCCPPNSWGPLLSKHANAGEWVKIYGNMSAYRVGSGKRGVLYANDIFGLGNKNGHGGRHTLYCDELAKLGYHVLAPDYWRGITAEWHEPGPRVTGPNGGDLLRRHQLEVRHPTSRIADGFC